MPRSLTNTFDVTKYSLRSLNALGSLFNLIYDCALNLFVFCWVESPSEVKIFASKNCKSIKYHAANVR